MQALFKALSQVLSRIFSQALCLLLLRVSTGTYLIIWGWMKIFNSQATIGLSEAYYGGLLSAELVNKGVGLAEVIVGLLVVLGLFRKYSYLAQALIYGVGLIAISPYILDPFARYLVDTSKVTWFPSTTLFAATLIMLVFKKLDTMALDIKFQKQEAQVGLEENSE